MKTVALLGAIGFGREFLERQKILTKDRKTLSPVPEKSRGRASVLQGSWAGLYC